MSTNSTQPYVPCTLQTCPLSEAPITYLPNLGGNAFFVAVFATILAVQLYLSIRHRTWSFLVAMTCGLILEVVGYAARIQLHANPFVFNSFIQYLVCLTIGPAFFTAAIYVSFRRIVLSYDESISWIRPKILSIVFMTSDFICLVLQAAGGAITSLSGGTSAGAAAARQSGINIMIAGLALQVVSLSIFVAYAVLFMRRWHVTKKISGLFGERQPKGIWWKGFLWGVGTATITILIRSAYRVAELKDGFQSRIASDQVAFMILEGAMIVIACLCLTIFHPGICLGRPWQISDRGTHVGPNVALGGVEEHEHGKI